MKYWPCTKEHIISTTTHPAGKTGVPFSLNIVSLTSETTVKDRTLIAFVQVIRKLIYFDNYLYFTISENRVIQAPGDI